MHMCSKTLAMLIFIWTAVGTVAQGEDIILSSRWRFKLDRTNQGEAQGWGDIAFWNNDKEPESVYLPGSIQTQGLGDMPAARAPWTASIGLRPGPGGVRPIDAPKYAPHQNEGQFKTPFWLTPLRVYVGAAWF